MLSRLIEALTIFRKYGDPYSPTHCQHDEMYVLISPSLVSDEDKAALDELGFFPSDDSDCFESYEYGRA